MPLVSVIIPTYNRLELLRTTLQTVLQQTFATVEIVVVDDGSTDGTAAWLADAVPAARVVALPRVGHLDTLRNLGVAAATGDLIAFLDSDDLWREDKLAQQVAVMQAQPAIGMVFTDVQAILPDGTLTPPLLTDDQKRPDGVFRRLLGGCFIHPSTVMLRRTLFERLGPFETSFRTQGDYAFWMRAARAAQACCLAEPLVTVRRTATSLSQSSSIQQMEDAIDALRFVAASEPLSAIERLTVRRTLSRWHAHLGLLRLPSDPGQARRELWQSLRLNPAQRRAWHALAAVERKRRTA